MQPNIAALREKESLVETQLLTAPRGVLLALKFLTRQKEKKKKSVLKQVLNCSVIRHGIHVISPAAEPLALLSILSPSLTAPTCAMAQQPNLVQKEQPWGQGSSSLLL